MEPEQILSQIRNRDLLKGAVNAYHISIGHHAKYHCVTEFSLSCQAKVTCTWLDDVIWNNRRTCLYICDTAALDRLQTAVGKLSLIKRGVAVPHVNFTTRTSTVEWLMFRNDTTDFSGSDMDSLSKIWFAIDQEFQSIFNYVAQLHNLIPSRLTATLKYQINDVTTLQRLQKVPQLDATLNIMIVQPGGILSSIFPSPNLEDNGSIAPHTYILHPKCCEEKNSTMGFATTLSNASALSEGQLRYHQVTNKVSAYLQCFISQPHQCRGNESSMKVPTFLESEITIKEEPLSVDDNLPEGSIVHDWRDQGMIVSESDDITSPNNILRLPSKEQPQHMLLDHCLWQSSPKRLPRRMLTQELHKYFGLLLQCPKCSVGFKFGLKGEGWSLLICHVHEKHRKLKSHCLSVIKRRYGAVLKDARVS